MTEYIIGIEGTLHEDYIELAPKISGEIIRCRDCKHARNDESGNLRCNGYLVAPWDYYNDEPSDGEIVEPDGFCKWGERREA